MGYSSETYMQAKTALERQRIKNEQQLEQRRQLLFSRSPRAKEIEYAIAKTSVAAAKAVFGGKDLKMELAKLKLNNQALQKELADMIAGFGLPANYLEMWYRCDKCRDYGFVDDKICTCMKALLRDIEYQKLNAISPLKLSDFDTFSLEYYSKAPSSERPVSDYTHMSMVLGFCRRYAREFSENSRSLLFQGGPGLGKTHLSLAIAKAAIDSGHGVIYVSAPAILHKIEREHFSNKTDNETEQTITECDLLILDDLGTEFTTNFTVSALYNIINTRMITSKPTIISTNLTISDLQEKYNIRMISRIIGMLDRVEFVGTDIRQLKKMKAKE